MNSYTKKLSNEQIEEMHATMYDFLDKFSSYDNHDISTEWEDNFVTKDGTEFRLRATINYQIGMFEITFLAPEFRDVCVIEPHMHTLAIYLDGECLSVQVNMDKHVHEILSYIMTYYLSLSCTLRTHGVIEKSGTGQWEISTSIFPNRRAKIIDTTRCGWITEIHPEDGGFIVVEMDDPINKMNQRFHQYADGKSYDLNRRFVVGFDEYDKIWKTI